MPAPNFENELASSTLRPHFKASEFFSIGAGFEEEINATHARTFLQHGGCPSFALKCARCVGSQPTAKQRFFSHVFILTVSAKVAFISSVEGCRFGFSSLTSYVVQQIARLESGISPFTLVWHYKLPRWFQILKQGPRQTNYIRRNIQQMWRTRANY